MLHPLSRRQILRGAGSVAIALPFYGGRVDSARAAAPKRLVTFFFGNGMPPSYSAGAFSSPVLAPLASLGPKIALLRGISNQSAKGGRGHPHARGGASFAIGYSNPSVETAGGVSLDVAAHEAFKPGTPISSLAASLWWWSEDIVRNTHSWQGRNRPNPGLTKPLALFHRVFGGQEMMPAPGIPAPDAEAILKQRRYKRSVLDTVLEGYKTLKSDRSGLPAGVRATLANHLESVRSLERRAIAAEEAAAGNGPARPMACDAVAAPPDLSPQQTCSRGCDTKGSTGGHDAGGGTNRTSNWDQVWPVLADLFVLALRCDVARFGNLTCTAAGDRYNYPGQGSNVHDLAHAWRPGRENGFDKSATWVMGGLAYFLEKMNETDSAGPGRTLLDETAVLAGTEVGDPAPHSFANLTFFVAGGGVFRPGVYDFGNRHTDVDLYSTFARSVGLGERFGDPQHFTGYLPEVGL